MDARLEVEIGADIKDLQSKVNSATKDLKDFGKDSKNNLNTFSTSTASATKSMANFKKGAISGDSALTSFSRTIQDAPFGIMGVSNNITNLTEQFGYLKAKTGSAKTALSAMFTSLKGFGGISLLISVATSALLVFGDKISFTSSKTKEFTDSLDGISSKGIVEFKALTDTILDTNASQREQSRAIEILKEKYSDFDTSLLTTKGNYEAGKIAIDNYISSLVQQAKAQAALTLIQEKQSQILKLEEEKALKLKKRFGVNTVQEAQNIVDAENKLAEKGYDVRQKRAANNSEYALNNLKDYNKKEIDEIQGQITTLTSLANVRDLILFGDKGKKPPKLPKPPKLTYIPEIEVDFSKSEILETVDLEDDWIGDNAFNWEEYFKLKEFDENRTLLNEKMLSMSEQINDIVNNGISSSFTSLANNISNSLGQSAGIFGNFVGQIIKMGAKLLIAQLTQDKAKMVSNLAVAKTNAVVTATETASKTPFGAFILPALINASVGAVASAFSGIGSSNATSTDSSGTNFSSGFSGGYSQNNTVTFVLRGQDLYGAIDNYMRRNGNQGVNLSTI